MNAVQVADLEEAIKAKERRIAVLRAEIRDLRAAIQAQCQHVWKWTQIAGEGRVCTKCNLHDYHCDD